MARTILFIACWILAYTWVLGQPPHIERAYDRSTDLINVHSEEAMTGFLDSLRQRAVTDEEVVLYELLRGRWLRHIGRKLDAHHLFDSLRVQADRHHPFLSYLLHYQEAKILKSLEAFDQARIHAIAAQKAALLCDLPDDALEMELLAYEIDLDNSKFEEALAGFEKLLQRSRDRKHDEGICRALIGMGNAYYYQASDAEALNYFQQALEVAKRMKEQGLIMSSVLNVGAALSFTEGPQAAIDLYRSVLDTIGTSITPSMQADLLSNLASCYSDIGDDQNALVEVNKALVIHGNLKDTASMAHSHYFKATALWNLGKRTEALDEILICRARTSNLDLKIQATRKATDYLDSLGRRTEAFVFLNEYATLQDSLSRSKYSDGVAKAQIRFETAEKERRILEQDQALKLSAAEADRRSTQRNILIASTLILGLVALLLTRTIRTRKRLAGKEKELHDEQVDQLLSQQEIKSINAMLEGQENERDRMAKDLHDRLGSMLGGIKVNMAALEDRVEQVQKDQQFEKVNRLLDQAVGELRQISHDMAAATLSRFGLEKALKDLRDTIHINGRLSVELNVFGLDQRLERSVELAVYRVVQELVSNVLKHAQARELSIAVTRTPGRLSVVVSDDGKGFDTTLPAEGMGLSNVRSRAAALGATVQVDSTPGKGTTVSVECPVVE